MSAQQSVETSIALIQQDLKGIRVDVEQLYQEIKDGNKAIRDEQMHIDRRVRLLEEERIRMRVLMLPLSIVISAALSFGTQTFMQSIAKEAPNGAQTKPQ